MKTTKKRRLRAPKLADRATKEGSNKVTRDWAQGSIRMRRGGRMQSLSSPVSFRKEMVVEMIDPSALPCGSV